MSTGTTQAQIGVKQEFFRFAETISVKGVSRILKARNIIHRVLWTIAVVTSLCILLWQLSTVLITYFNWPVDTLVAESTDQPSFPDVTICNLYPTYSLESMTDNISWLAFAAALVKVQNICTNEKLNGMTTYSDADYGDLISYLYTRTGYFLNFPIVDENFKFDDNLIKVSQVYNWQWRENKSGLCEPSLKYLWDPNYYACRTLSIPDGCQGDIRGLTLILYIHNFPDVLQLGYRPGFIGSQATGVVVAIHAPGTLPDLKMANSVGPGTENNMRMLPIVRSRLPEPYSDCTNQTYIESQSTENNDDLLYTEAICIDICFQQRVLDSCGCLSGAFQFSLEQQIKANGVVCGNLSLLENSSTSFLSKGMKDYLCSITVDLDQNGCEDECITQCNELSYELIMSSAPWPHVSTQLVFAKAMNVSNASYESKFDIYMHILNEYEINKNSSMALEQLEQVDLITNNFLQLNIFFESYSTLLLTDVPTLTSNKLLGLIGGALSLWLGITIMTLIEVLEFVCTLVCLYIQKDKAAERPAARIHLQAAVNESRTKTKQISTVE